MFVLCVNYLQCTYIMIYCNVNILWRSDMPRTRTTNFTVRLDAQVKEDAEKLFSDLGITLSGAFNIFLHQALQVQGLPFEVRRKQPNKVTLAAMEEALMLAKDPQAETYSSVEELKKDLDL